MYIRRPLQCPTLMHMHTYTFYQCVHKNLSFILTGLRIATLAADNRCVRVCMCVCVCVCVRVCVCVCEVCDKKILVLCKKFLFVAENHNEEYCGISLNNVKMKLPLLI